MEKNWSAEFPGSQAKTVFDHYLYKKQHLSIRNQEFSPYHYSVSCLTPSAWNCLESPGKGVSVECFLMCDALIHNWSRKA